MFLYIRQSYCNDILGILIIMTSFSFQSAWYAFKCNNCVIIAEIRWINYWILLRNYSPLLKPLLMALWGQNITRVCVIIKDTLRRFIPKDGSVQDIQGRREQNGNICRLFKLIMSLGQFFNVLFIICFSQKCINNAFLKLQLLMHF